MPQKLTLGEVDWMGEIRFAKPATGGQVSTWHIVVPPDYYDETADLVEEEPDVHVEDEPDVQIVKPTSKKWIGTLPKPVDAAIFMDEELPERKEVICGVVHRGAIMSLGGGSKTRKSWSLLDMVLSVTTGSPFWGMPVNPGRVIYCNLELPPQDLQKRFFEIAKKKQVDVPPKTLLFWNLRGSSYNIEQLKEVAIANFANSDISMVVIDPIYKCYADRDENSATDMTSLLQELDLMSQKLNAAVVFAAHFAKGNAAGKAAMDRVSGSGVFSRYPDTIMVSTEHENPDSYTIDVVTRSFPPQKSFVVKWAHPLMERDLTAHPSRLKHGAGSSVNTSDFLRILSEHPLIYTEWQMGAFQTLGINLTSFGDHRDRVIQAGYVEKVMDGKKGKYVLTKKGKDYVAANPPLTSTPSDQDVEPGTAEDDKPFD